MKNILVFMLCISVYSVNAGEKKTPISFFIQQSPELIRKYFQNPHDFVDVLPTRNKRLQVFQDITKKFDEGLIDRQKSIESLLAMKNVNKKRCFNDGYTLHNKNGKIIESYSGKIFRSFFIENVDHVARNDLSVQIILKNN